MIKRNRDLRKENPAAPFSTAGRYSSNFRSNRGFRAPILARRRHWSVVLVAACAPVHRFCRAQDADSYTADAQHSESDVFHGMIHERRINWVDAASDDRKMTGRNVLCASARLRIRNVNRSVLNLHVRELFAILISVTGGPFAVTQ